VTGFGGDPEHPKPLLNIDGVRAEWRNGGPDWSAMLFCVNDEQAPLVYVNRRTVPKIYLPCVERWVRVALRERPYVLPFGTLVMFPEELRYYGAPSR
jgi:hypothetical protein